MCLLLFKFAENRKFANHHRIRFENLAAKRDYVQFFFVCALFLLYDLQKVEHTA